MIKLLVYIFCISVSLGANTLNIDDKKVYENFEISYIKDETLKLDIKSIQNQKFKKAKSNFNLGYTKGALWIRFSLKNSSDIDNFILSVGESFYEVANLYYYDNGWIKKSNSIFRPITKREVMSNHIAYDIDIPKNKETTYYLKLKGKYAYFGNLKIYKKNYFYYAQSNGVNTLFKFVLGIIFILIIYSLFLYIKTKEKIYLYYLGYSFFNFVYYLNISGLLVYVDMQEYIYDLHLSAGFMIGFLILFSIEYMEIEKYLKKTSIFLKYFAYIFFILGVLILFTYTPWNKFINNFSGLICIILIVTSIIIYLKGNKKTIYYTFAMVLYFSFVILFTFMVNGTFEYTNITRYGFVVGNILEIIIFSYLLATRYTDIKDNIQIYLKQQVDSSTNELSTLLNERELLLKEVHHRVKNNFHMLIGMLWLENKNSKELDKLITRVKSMSIIHEYLYKSKDISNIDTKEYIEKIVKNIAISYTKIKINSNIDSAIVEFEDAVSLGIITNEILTNAIKHNKNRDDFCIDIILINKDGFISLIIKDNGGGFNNPNKKGLGLKLVEQFSNKLKDSKSSFKFENGTKFELVYKKGE
jgi:two-component sensor histidine kinase